MQTMTSSRAIPRTQKSCCMNHCHFCLLFMNNGLMITKELAFFRMPCGLTKIIKSFFFVNGKIDRNLNVKKCTAKFLYSTSRGA